MGTITRVAKNTSLVSTEIILVNLLSFGFAVYVTRALGVMEFGKFAFAKAFMEMLVVWADLGLAKLLIREVARNREDISSYLPDFAAIKLLFSILTVAMIALLMRILGYEPEVIRIVYILGGAYLVHSFTGIPVSVFQGYERMGLGSSLSVFRSLLLILFGVTVLTGGYGLKGLCWSIFAANAIHALSAFFFLLNGFARIKFCFHPAVWWSIAKESFSFGVGSVFVRIYARIDSVMLSKMIGMTVVGLYNAAYNIVIALMFLPGALSQALFPVTSRYFETDPDKAKNIFERSFKYSVLIGFPAATGIAFLSDKIILMMYGTSFNEAAAALRILIWTLAFSFATAMLGNLLNSANQQIRTTYNMMICTAVNIGLNLILIPLYGFLGASAATVLTDVSLVTLSYLSVRKYVYAPRIAMPLIKAVLGSLVMGAALYFIRDGSLFLSISLGALVYAVMLLIVKVFDREDWNILQKMLFLKS